MTEQQEHGFVQMVKKYFPERGAVIFTLRPNGKMSMAIVSTDPNDRNQYLGLWELIKKDTDGTDQDTETQRGV